MRANIKSPQNHHNLVSKLLHARFILTGKWVMQSLPRRRRHQKESGGNLFDDYDSSGDEGEVLNMWSENPNDVHKATLTEEESYANFWERLSRPTSSNLVHHLRMFIERITSVSRHAGVRNNSAEGEVTDFLAKVENKIYAHVSWEDATDEELDAAREGLEKYVMSQIYKAVFAEPQDRILDEEISARCRGLHFITPDMLGVPNSCRNDVVLGLAQEELCRMNACNSPAEKIACVARSSQVLFTVLNRSSVSRGRAGADDFLPSLIYTVLRANVPQMWSNIEFIRRYRNPSD